MSLPRAVVETDHKLEGAHDRASEELAKHRWHWTLDESNPNRVPVREYARAIGRNDTVIARYAKGWAIYQDRMAAPRAGGAAFTLQDAIRQSELSVENQAFAEAIAEGSGRPIAQVSRGDNRHKMHEIVGQAKARAERQGTDPVEEARRIAEHQRRSQEMDARERQRKQSRHTLRYVEIEGHLANAQRRLLQALQTAEGVDFTQEEMDLIRDSIVKIRGVLALIDLRMTGTPDIDWDAEAAKLIGGEA
jgi:hypothetical protein